MVIIHIETIYDINTALSFPFPFFAIHLLFLLVEAHKRLIALTNQIKYLIELTPVCSNRLMFRFKRTNTYTISINFLFINTSLQTKLHIDVRCWNVLINIKSFHNLNFYFFWYLHFKTIHIDFITTSNIWRSNTKFILQQLFFAVDSPIFYVKL